MFTLQGQSAVAYCYVPQIFVFFIKGHTVLPRYEKWDPLLMDNGYVCLLRDIHLVLFKVQMSLLKSRSKRNGLF